MSFCFNHFSQTSDIRAWSEVSVTAGAQSKGSYTELVSSTAIDARWVTIAAWATSDYEFLWDLAIGGSGSEVIVAPDVYTSELASYGQMFRSVIVFPLSLPAGTRIAVRAGVNDVATQTMGMWGWYGSCGPFATQPQRSCKIAQLGVDTTNYTVTKMLSVPNSSGGESSYVEMTSSAPFDIRGMWIWSGEISSFSAFNLYLDVAVGGSGSEVNIMEDIFFRNNTTQNSNCPERIYIPVNIPAGTRIAVRGQQTTSINPQYPYVQMMIHD